jgi:hypothetical protein
MTSTQPATSEILTSPSFVIVPQADALPKLLYGLVILGLGMAFFVALMVFLAAVLPHLRERVRASMDLHPWRSLGLGFAGYLVLGSLAAFMYSRSSIQYLLRTEYEPALLAGAVAIVAVLIVTTLLGGSGLVQALGERIEQLNGQSMSGLRKTVWASLVLIGTCFFPVIGWCIVLPLSLPFAFGAALLALFPRSPY